MWKLSRALICNLRWALTRAFLREDRVPAIEIDNSISTSCPDHGAFEGNLHVMEFNAERGTEWFQFGIFVQQLARPPDVIILNEMDIGMARSNNVNTGTLVVHLTTLCDHTR